MIRNFEDDVRLLRIKRMKVKSEIYKVEFEKFKSEKNERNIAIGILHIEVLKLELVQRLVTAHLFSELG